MADLFYERAPEPDEDSRHALERPADWFELALRIWLLDLAPTPDDDPSPHRASPAQAHRRSYRAQMGVAAQIARQVRRRIVHRSQWRELTDCELDESLRTMESSVTRDMQRSDLAQLMRDVVVLQVLRDREQISISQTTLRNRLRKLPEDWRT